MTAFETTFHVGPDGKVHVTVPSEFVNKDVRVTVEPATNGDVTPISDESPEERRKFLDSVFGTIDDPTFERPPAGGTRVLSPAYTQI